MINGPKSAPSFEVTFNNKYLQGTYTVVDLSWYAPYKKYGDDVICMFSYLGFVWFCFKHATSIISGAAADYKVYQDGQPINYDTTGKRKGLIEYDRNNI